MNDRSLLPVFIEGRRLVLRPLAESDFTPEFHAWLNSPEVNRWSQKRAFPVGANEVPAYWNYYRQNPQEGFVLGMVERTSGKHIGNIALVNIQPIHRCAEITVFLGDRDYWNQGYSAEAIHLVTRHGFRELNLHRIFAGTFNPAFARCVEKLGWKEEGRFRERIWSDGRFHDQIWLGILRSEFGERPEYEKK